ncbi:hypothetical protein [Streptomyces sp. NBC_00203]
MKRFDAVTTQDVMSMPSEEEGSIVYCPLLRQKFLINLRDQVKRFDDR